MGRVGRTVGRWLHLHLVGLVGSSQMTFMVGAHAGWLFLIVISLQEGAGGETGRGAARGFLDAFVWLGGVDQSGRGDLGTLARAFGTLATLLYIADWYWTRWFGERAPWRYGRKLKYAAAFGYLGYGLGFVLMKASNAQVDGSTGDLVFVALMMGTFTAGASAWGLYMREKVLKGRRALRERWREEDAAREAGTQVQPGAPPQ